MVRFIFNLNREVVTEEDASGLNRLIRASELIAANSSADSARTYYHYASDEMGSTTHIVDEAGAVQNSYEYDAWGNITAQEEAVPNRFKFTGQQLDPVTQQYYLRARFYNPVVARFTQEDNYRGDGLNLYAYCANNPTFYCDPTGNLSQCMKDAYLEARRAGATKEEAYAAAKAAYEKNHVDSNPRPQVDVPDDRSMTREQWTEAYRDARAGVESSGKVPSVPQSLLVGDANTRVYLGIRDGQPVYAGITNDIARRQGEHGSRFTLSEITTEPLTRRQARAIEQALIEANPQFENKINSISPTRDWYNDAISWGNAWLKANGL